MENEEAVSPVIGVILMVAITVILAAVIAAFVFGMAGANPGSKNVGMVVRPVGNATTPLFEVTMQGGSDMGSMNTMEWSEVVGGTQSAWAPIAFPSGATLVVGDVMTFTPTAQTGERIMIRGSFTDGAQQVIFDKSY